MTKKCGSNVSKLKTSSGATLEDFCNIIQQAMDSNIKNVFHAVDKDSTLKCRECGRLSDGTMGFVAVGRRGTEDRWMCDKCFSAYVKEEQDAMRHEASLHVGEEK